MFLSAPREILVRSARGFISRSPERSRGGRQSEVGSSLFTHRSLAAWTDDVLLWEVEKDGGGILAGTRAAEVLRPTPRIQPAAERKGGQAGEQRQPSLDLR